MDEKCYMWKLEAEEYVLNNDTLLSIVHNHSYLPGEYIIRDGIAWVCIPDELLPAFVYADYVAIAFWILSMLCLLLCICVYLLFRRNSQNVMPLIFHMISLFVMYFICILIELRVHPSRLECYFYALLIEMSASAQTSWLNIISFSMWRQFRKDRIGLRQTPNMKRFICQSIYAWGVPLFIVISHNALRSINAPLQHGENTRCMCIFFTNIVQVTYYRCVRGLTVLANPVMLLLTSINMHRIRKDTILARNTYDCHTYLIDAKLVLISGVFWIWKVIVWLTFSQTTKIYLRSSSQLILSLQGLFVSLAYLGNESIRISIKEKLSLFKNSCSC